jgi:hypothetical protein
LVHPRAVGRRVHVTAGDETVVATLGAEVVARPPRVLAGHVTLTDPADDQARLADRALAERPNAGGDVEIRDLAVYDIATGVA